MKRVSRRFLFFLFFAALLGISAYAAETDYGLPVVHINTSVPLFPSVVSREFYAYFDADVSVLDADGREVYGEEGCQFRIFGHSSSKGRKKPYKLKFSESVDLFGLGSGRRWSLVPNLYDVTLMRNKLVYDLAGSLGLAYSPRSTYVELYYNGEYQGNYLLVTPMEVGENRVDISMARGEFLFEVMPEYRSAAGTTFITPMLGIGFELNDVPYLPPDQREDLNGFFRRAEEALLSGDRERIEQYFDIQSFLDAYIIHELSKDADVSIASTRFYLRRGLLYAGPMWDFDLSCGNDREEPDVRHHWNGTIPVDVDGWYACQLWWEKLVQCDWFLALFAARYQEVQPLLVNLYQDNELGKNRIDAVADGIRLSVDHNFTVYMIHSPYYYHNARIPFATYEQNVEYLRDWLRARNEWILSQIEQGGRFITVSDSQQKTPGAEYGFIQ